MTQFRFEYAARTDKGLVRETNEDAFGTLPEDGMVVVADGMGGYSAGEVASQLAVDTVLRHMHREIGSEAEGEPLAEVMEAAIKEANLAIWRTTDNAPELRGMGTTVVAGLFRARMLVYSWVGDSRLYRVRAGGLAQLNRDHTLIQELVDQELFDSMAEAKEAGVGDNVLTRALGAEGPVAAESAITELAEGDLYLFCSDGLNHMVADDAIAAALVDPGGELGVKADRLVALACESGGSDNITVVLVNVVRV